MAADGMNVKVKSGRLELCQGPLPVDLIPSHIKKMLPAHLFKRAYKRHSANENMMLSPRRVQERDKQDV